VFSKTMIDQLVPMNVRPARAGSRRSGRALPRFRRSANMSDRLCPFNGAMDGRRQRAGLAASKNGMRTINRPAFSAEFIHVNSACRACN